jgi:hypothetical protein
MVENPSSDSDPGGEVRWPGVVAFRTIDVVQCFKGSMKDFLITLYLPIRRKIGSQTQKVSDGYVQARMVHELT